jgi:hypothetical protein
VGGAGFAGTLAGTHGRGHACRGPRRRLWRWKGTGSRAAVQAAWRGALTLARPWPRPSSLRSQEKVYLILEYAAKVGPTTTGLGGPSCTKRSAAAAGRGLETRSLCQRSVEPVPNPGLMFMPRTPAHRPQGELYKELQRIGHFDERRTATCAAAAGAGCLACAAAGCPPRLPGSLAPRGAVARGPRTTSTAGHALAHCGAPHPLHPCPPGTLSRCRARCTTATPSTSSTETSSRRTCWCARAGQLQAGAGVTTAAAGRAVPHRAAGLTSPASLPGTRP